MEISRRRLLGAVGAVALAGCTGEPDTSAASTLTTETETTSPSTQTTTESQGAIESTSIGAREQRPGIVVSYSLEDYGLLLLEDSEGSILAEKRVSPSASQAHFPTSRPLIGEYRVVLRQGDDTVGTTTLSFAGPNIEIDSIEQHWDGATLTGIDVSVSNTGDYYGFFDELYYEFNEETHPKHFNYWYLIPGSNETVSISSPVTVPVSSPGTHTGTVTLDTVSAGTLSKQFSKTFDGPNLEFQSTDAAWSGRTLNEINVTVANTGDLPADVDATVKREGEKLMRTLSASIETGEATTISFGEIRLDRYDGSGTAQYTVTLSSNWDSAEATVTKSFD